VNSIPVICTRRSIVQAPNRRRARLQMREIFRKIAILNYRSMRRRHVSNVLSAKHHIKGIPRNRFSDPEPVIDKSLVKENPGTEDWLEYWIVGTVDVVKESRTTVKILKTCLIKLFTQKRNLVTGLGRREDRMNCNSLAATLNAQTRVNKKYLHGLAAVM
jgi:hypothetical protein